MPNSLLIAAKGKGILPMLARSRMIVNRYGFTTEKMDAALAALMEPLIDYSCSATLPITASALASNPNTIKKHSLRGLEFAVHGLHHLDYSQLSLEQQLKHIRDAREIFNHLDIPVSGFRCPYLRWNDDTLIALEKTGFDYDSSQALSMDVVGEFSTETYRRVLDFYRAQSANDYPSLPSWSNNMIRIPYCLPDDEALIDRLHITDSGIMAHIWLAMLDHVYQLGELFTLGLHPERAPACKVALQAVLAKARMLSPGVWVARLDEIAAWFRSLEQTTCKIENEGGELYYVRIIGPERATVLVRSSEIIAPTQPWDIEFKVVCSNEFFLRSDKRPLIGLSPSSPFSLQRFLRSQGYLVELSIDSDNNSVYLDQDTFSHEDERPLLEKLKQDHKPLVRLSRWPDALRCGLAITGDIDALTIWDYAKRIFIR